MAFDPRASKVRLVVLDVDGVLSDGSIVFSNEGELFKAFNVRDGLGIKLLQRAGIEVAILTGRTSGIVARRAEELGMKRIEQGKLRKLPTLLKMLDELNISAEELAYMGDDLPDLPCLRRLLRQRGQILPGLRRPSVRRRRWTSHSNSMKRAPRPSGRG